MSKKQQPKKDPWFEFYILWPIQNLGEDIVGIFRTLRRKVTGAWWCEHCEKFHGRRVHKFILKPTIAQQLVGAITAKPAEDRWVCSLYKEQKIEIELETDPSTAVNNTSVYKEEMTT